LADKEFGGDFWLTQIVSHHHRPEVERLLKDVEGRGVTAPGIFGVFYYRSANGKTLERLSQFFPVPSAELTREFESGAAPEEVCARTLRALLEIGVKNIYVSNLPIRGSAARLERIIQLARDKNS
jgi:hypothetical protein